jgi:hypothetical protein
MARVQFVQRDVAGGGALPVADVAVGGDHRIESGMLRRRQQRPVRQPIPAHLACGLDIVIRQQGPRGARHARVKQQPAHALLRRR